MSKQERDKLLLTLHNFKTELFLSYVNMKFEAALINSSINWYKFASYMIEEENGIFKVACLNLFKILRLVSSKFYYRFIIVSAEFQQFRHL
ncbi:hypothetical protein RirG_106050 [Rhizophagus irregularis DAOM 197198w]|uniref:Uncharacterized protein n=1 Tax=Rhizophagus irregularis (strain DAOM 197198w) TaxID=1432141 RepID=A0A015KLE1_RHIIW|nr:hypothetical protein RirG_106050 [Rhizophagus irregularis DAOM 197198w]